MKNFVWKPAAILVAALLAGLFSRESASAAPCASPSFVAAGTLTVGSQPVWVAVADLNGDGRPDIVVANQFSANVSVLLGLGNGNFQSAVNYPAGFGPSFVGVRDVNGDSRPDVVVTDVGTTNIWVLRGNANGTLQTAIESPVENFAQALAFGDFNRDGRQDVAAALRVSSSVASLHGNGNGTFQAGVNYLTGPDPFSVAVGDFNADNFPDLAVANAALFEDPPGISVLLGRSTGAFRLAVDYAAGVSPRSVVIGDFNGDGRQDLAVANSGGFVGGQFTNSSISILLGNGDGTFPAPVNYQAGESPLSLVTTDLNGDGLLDLAAANSRSGNVSVLFGQSDGTFTTRVNFGAGANPRSIASGDFNNDMQPDLAVVNDSGLLIMLSTCIAAADLSVTQADSPDPLPAGDEVTYTVTVNNGGPDPAADVTLTNRLPAGVTFVEVISSQGGCTNDAGVINCGLGTIANGGQATVTITVAAMNRGSLTNTATAFSLTTSDPNTANNTSSATTAVLPVVSLAATDADAAEAGFDPATFTVSRTGGTVGSLTVNYSLSGTAANGADYSPLSGSVIIPNGAASATITATPIDDPDVEPTETVVVTLLSSTSYFVDSSANSGTATILDNDVPSLAIGDAALLEGGADTSVVFTVSMFPPFNQTVTVNYSTANGTAIAGADYVSTNGVLTFPPGATNQTIAVLVLGDDLNEANETFAVNLSNPMNAVLGDGQGTGTITNDDPVPSLSIDDVEVTEGDSGTTNAIFTVTLSAASGRTVTVNFTTAAGTATAGTDYVTTNGSLSFAPGVLAQSLTVRVNGDLVSELEESFFVNLSTASNASIGDPQGEGSIVNDDGVPSISISDVTVLERNTATTNAIFTVLLSAPSSQTVTVNFASSDGTATAPADYVSTNGLVSFPAGITNRTVTVRVNGDVLNETSETFFVSLSNPTNAAIADAQGVGTITDNDPLPSLSISDVVLVEGNSGTTNAVFNVTLSAASGQTVTVNFSTENNTAIAPSDFAPTNGMLTFAPGTTSRSITVRVNGDVATETDEVFFVTLSTAVNASISDGQGTGTILNEDTLPALSISDESVVERNSGTTNMVFTVNLSSTNPEPISVDFATANGTATAGTDYTSTNGVLIFSPGTSNRTITVSINGDTLNEADETFFVNLSNPTNAAIANSQGIGTIIDNDPLPSVSIHNVTVTEGNSGTTNALFAVTLSMAYTATVTVNYSTADGTATAGPDYTATNGVLSFAPGQTNRTISVAVRGELVDEPDETFFVNLSAPTNAVIGDGQGLGTIDNDDALPALSIQDVSVFEGNAGTTNALLTVRLSGPSLQTVSVAFATAEATATADVDYFSTNGVLTFVPGMTSQVVAVRVIGDLLNEADEGFAVNLSSPANATISDSQGTAMIVNDDAVPAISINDVAVFEGNSGTTNAVFTIQLSVPSAQVVTVTYATAHNTTSGNDYSSRSGLITFSPGQTNQTISISINGDTRTEGNETYFVNLSAPVNATLADTQGIGTILNDEGVPSIFIADAIVGEPNTGTSNALFVVRLSATHSQPVTLSFATSNGTASAGVDFIHTNGVVTINAGTTSQIVVVPVIGDRINESNENFFVNLFSSTNGLISDPVGQGTINNDDPLPALSVTDVAVVEGNSGTKDATFTVALSEISGQTVTVNFATANGTAQSGSDYVASNGALTFAPGTTSQTVTVSITGDALNEDDETFSLNLSGAVNATLGDGQGTGTINNDDPLPNLSVNDVTLTEGDAGTTNAVFTIRLSEASGRAVNLEFLTGNGTATAGADYTATNGALVFPAGTTNRTVSVVVAGDLLNEADETFFLILTNVVNANVTDNQGRGTINNNDPLPTLSIDSVVLTEADDGTTNAVFAVRLTPVSGQLVTVNFATANSTAVAGSDYVTTNGTISLPPGTTNASITVRVNNDLLNEADERFFVNLSNPGNVALATNQATGTILNDDPLPSLSISPVTVTEGNSGTVNAVFALNLSSASGQSVSVAFATADGTASAGADYVATNGTVTFPEGTTSRTITVVVRGDPSDEPDETFTVNLSNPVNVVLASGQATGTITDDDLPPALAINNVAVAEGNSGTSEAVFTVTLSEVSGLPVTVNYATADGTALAGADYMAASGALTFAPGTRTQTITVSINGDPVNEADQTFVVNLSGAVNATIADAEGIGTITNDDPLASLSINDVAVTEGNSGTMTATLTVRLSAESEQTITVSYGTADGSAGAAADYVTANGTLTFAPGVTNQSVTVAVLGESLYEDNESFRVNLSSPVNALIGDGQGVVTINNDDVPPTLSIEDVTVTERNSGTTNAVFTLRLSEISGVQATVNYATADGTALAGSDYVATNGIVAFAPGTTIQTVTVRVNGDVVNELDQTFLVNLSGAAHATLNDAQGVGTILNDDPVPLISINDAALTEGNSGTTNALFLVRLSAPSEQGVVVDFVTANGTALAGEDYVATNGAINFAAGVTSQPVAVRVLGDALYESNETFFVNLGVSLNGVISDGEAVATIINDDALPTVSIADLTITEGDSGVTEAILSVQLTGLSSHTVTVNFATANGSALAGTDYMATNGTVTFAPGVATQTVSIPVIGETLNESNETLLVNLSAASYATISDGEAIVTIANDDPVVSIRITDAAVFEGNSGSTNAVFLVSLSGPSGLPVAVAYATAHGTTSGNDFQSASGTLNFAPGQTNQIVLVGVNGDTRSEENETFFVNLTGPVNATLADSQAIGTILNDERVPSISITDATVVEGHVGTTNAAFVLRLSESHSQIVSVRYATSDGTADGGIDYLATNGLVNFNPGVTEQTIIVRVFGDRSNESNETFFVNLIGSTNGLISDFRGNGTINNDDPLPAISINDVSAVEGNAGTTDAVFLVRLSEVSGQVVGVQYATGNGTATAGSDYLATNGLVTFSPGTTEQMITVRIIGDQSNESDETFFVNLSSPANATISDAQAVGTIRDDDAVPSISITDATLVEGDTGTTNAVFTVRLSDTPSEAVSVRYATANGTATAGSDYVATNGIVTFGPGVIEQTVRVPIVGDALNETNETFFVNLSDPSNAVIGDSQSLGMILNDDAAPSISITDATVVEGDTGTSNAVFLVRLSGASALTVSIGYATGNNGATAGSDYLATNGTVTFNPGVTEQTIRVPIVGDALNETNETFFVDLSDPTNALIGDGQAIGTILNDDAMPSISITDATAVEGDTGTSNAVFVVRLSGGSALTVSVGYATGNNGATAGSDYLATNGTVTFNPGVTEQTITVAVLSDNANESNETFFVNLSDATNATIADAQGLGTIVDDDPIEILLSTNSVAIAEGGTNSFGVRLSAAPASDIVATVTRASGDTNFSISEGGLLTFTAANWDVFQTVSIRSPEDENSMNEAAVFAVEAAGSSGSVNVSAIDNDTEVTRLMGLQFSGNSVLIRFTTAPGQQYRVERSESLTSDWAPVGEAVTGTGELVEVIDAAISGPGGRFYRVVRLAP